MKKLLPAFTAILFALSARASRAETEQPISPKAKERFGDVGNVVIGGDFSFAFQRSRMNENASLTGFGVHPSLDYFVLDHLSIGTSVGISHMTSKWYDNENSQTTLSAAPRIGYEFPLGDTFSLWPTAGIAYYRVVWSTSAMASMWERKLDVYGRAVLLAHVAKHFFVGGGPFVNVNLSRSAAMLGDYDIGFNSTLGGWI
jgi:hypothetical protein